jgi:ABC-type transport system involved in multi-copper enzyme maturation permease subunit
VKILALISYTARELASKPALYVLAGISTIIIIFMLLGLSSQVTEGSTAVTMFGIPITSLMSTNEIEKLILLLEVGLADGLFSGVVIFGVIATAGIIPRMMDRGTIDLYLSKPIARWQLLLGKSVGAVAVVFLNILYFLGGMWLTVGIKIGVWNAHLIWAVFLLTLLFACLFCLVLLLGVISRSSALPILGAFLYLLVVTGILEHREAGLSVFSDNTIYRGILDGLYYVLPQLSALKKSVSDQIMGSTFDWRPLIQSALSAGLLFLGSAAIFSRKDF